MMAKESFYHTVSISPSEPDARSDESLLPKVSNRRRHLQLSHDDISVLVITIVDICLAALQ